MGGEEVSRIWEVRVSTSENIGWFDMELRCYYNNNKYYYYIIIIIVIIIIIIIIIIILM